MIKKSFELSLVKEKKGKIAVKFEEIAKISPYIKEETNNLLIDILESKLSESLDSSKEAIESQMGGANEQ